MFDDIRMPAENSNADEANLALNDRLANLDDEILLADNRPNQRNINGMDVTRPNLNQRTINGMDVTRPLDGRGDKVALQQGFNPYTGQSYFTPEGLKQYQQAALLQELTGLPLLPQNQYNPYQPNPFQPYPYQTNGGPGNLGQNLLYNMLNQGNQGRYYQNPAGPNWGQPPINFPRDPMTGEFLNPNDPRYYDPRYNPNINLNNGRYYDPNYPPYSPNYPPYQPPSPYDPYQPNPYRPPTPKPIPPPNPNTNCGGGRQRFGGLLGIIARIGIFTGLMSMLGGGGFGGGGFGSILGFGLLGGLLGGGGGFGGGLFGPLSYFRRR